MRTDGREGREGRVRLRRSSASKAAGILLKPLKKIQNSLLRRSNSWIFSSNADSHRLRSAPLLQSQPKPDATSPADVRRSGVLE